MSEPNRPEEKASAYMHIVAGLPLILGLVGGAIGGACGGGAYALSISVFKSKGFNLLTVLLSLVIGAIAAGIWLGIVMLFFAKE